MKPHVLQAVAERLALNAVRSKVSSPLPAVDYRGQHTAPTADAAPLHDLTAGTVYGDDVYSVNGPRYYGPGDGSDAGTWAVIRSVHGMPRAPVRIYRAVPKQFTFADRIAEIEQQKRYILKHGRVPPNVETPLDRSRYYDRIDNELQRLRIRLDTEGEIEIQPMQINPGDWVAIDRKYAIQHGESALRGQYKVLTKTVPASTLFTNGDSIEEWGYNP